MPDPEFTEDEIEALRQKLDSPELSPRERELLTAAFVAAKEQASQTRAKAEAASTLVNLREQLSTAYSPGDQSGITVEVRIHPTPPIS